MRIRFTSETNGVTREILTESACFRIDEKFTHVHALAVLSALQAYIRDANYKTEAWNRVQHQNRTLELYLTVVCARKEMLQFLYYWLSKEKIAGLEDLPSVDDLSIDCFDYYVDVSFEKIMDITRVGKLPLYQGLGILIGADVPSLANLAFEYDVYSVKGGSLLVAPRMYNIYSKIENKFSERFSSVTYMGYEKEELLKPSVIARVRGSEAVIGYRGFTTYAASCLKKPVLEILDSQILDSKARETFWSLTQWSNPYYLPVIPKNSDDVSSIERGLDKLWGMVISHRDSITQTAPEMSSVGSADVL